MNDNGVLPRLACDFIVGKDRPDSWMVKQNID